MATAKKTPKKKVAKMKVAKKKVSKKKAHKPCMTVSLKMEKEVQVSDIIYAAIEKYGAKNVLGQLYSHAYMNSAIVESPFCAMLKNEKEVEKLIENAEVVHVLCYAFDHWDELKDKGKNLIDEKTRKHQREK